MSAQLTDIAIVGAGGLGKETAVLIDQINKHAKTWNLIGFFDDGVPAGTRILSIPVLGNVTELNAYKNSLNIVIAIGDPNIKSQLVERLTNRVVSFPVLTHPTAVIGQEVTLGEGSMITAGCVLTADIAIGKHVLINLNSTIGHDVTLGNYTSVMPGAHISGAVTVGERVFIGTGVAILQHLTIAHDAIIGAGAVVTKSVLKAETVVGIPARTLSTKPNP